MLRASSVLTGHLYIIFGEMSIQVLSQFLFYFIMLGLFLQAFSLVAVSGGYSPVVIAGPALFS